MYNVCVRACELRSRACSGRFVMLLGAPRVEQPGIKLGDDERAQTMHLEIASKRKKKASKTANGLPTSDPLLRPKMYPDLTRPRHLPSSGLPILTPPHPLHPPFKLGVLAWGEPTIAESGQVPLGADGISRAGLRCCPTRRTSPPPLPGQQPRLVPGHHPVLDNGGDGTI